MAHFCPKCYGKSFITVPLKHKDNGELVCTRDSAHVFLLDKEGFPRSKKD